MYDKNDLIDPFFAIGYQNCLYICFEMHEEFAVILVFFEIT